MDKYVGIFFVSDDIFLKIKTSYDISNGWGGAKIQKFNNLKI